MKIREQRVRLKGERENLLEFTLYIDNLPINLDNFGLKRICARFGKLFDAYVWRKVGKKSVEDSRF